MAWIAEVRTRADVLALGGGVFFEVLGEIEQARGGARPVLVEEFRLG